MWQTRPIRVVNLGDVVMSIGPSAEIVNLRSKADLYPDPPRGEILTILNRCEKALHDAKAVSDATPGEQWAKVAAWEKAVAEKVTPCITEAKAVFDRPESEFLMLKERARKLTGPAAAEIEKDIALCENVIGSRQPNSVKRQCLSVLARRIMEARDGTFETPQPTGSPPQVEPQADEAPEPAGIPTLALIGGGALVAAGLVAVFVSS